MIDELTPEELKRYSRHLALPDFNHKHQLMLKNARVLVIGAGGLGSPLLLYLAAAGIGTIGIVEGDNINISNLQRQILFRSGQTGMPKIKVAEDELKKLNPEIKIESFNQFLTKSNALEIIKKYDIIADGSDNFGTRYLVNDACVILGKPLVYGAVFRYEGQLSVLNAVNENGKRSANYRNLFPEPPSPESIPNCEEGGVLGALPGIIGSMQAAEVVKLITKIGQPLIGKLYIFDLFNFNSQTVDFSSMPAFEIKELSYYEITCEITMKEITAQELKEMQENKEEIQLVDVREPYERDIASIGGDLIPMHEVPFADEKISKDKKVIFYCRAGGRSAQAIKMLEQRHGYDNLYNLKGGILAWADEIDPEMEKY